MGGSRIVHEQLCHELLMILFKKLQIMNSCGPRRICGNSEKSQLDRCLKRKIIINELNAKPVTDSSEKTDDHEQ